MLMGQRICRTQESTTRLILKTPRAIGWKSITPRIRGQDKPGKRCSELLRLSRRLLPAFAFPPSCSQFASLFGDRYGLREAVRDLSRIRQAGG